MNTKISDVAIKHVKVRSPATATPPRRLSKQGSVSGTSAVEIYYGDSSVSVPFRWESRPGTPKVNSGDRRPLPPLTPPPSYLSSPARKSGKKHHLEAGDVYSSGGILHNVLPRLNLIRKSHSHSSSPPSSFSSSSSSSSSSRSDSESRPRSSKLAHHLRRKDGEDEEDEEDEEEKETQLESLCFGISGRSNSSKRGCSANFIKLLLRQHA